MEPFTIILLAIITFFASFYSVIVGGGPLLTVPIMVSLGIPAASSVAIARLYSLGVAGSSLFELNRKGKVNWRTGLPLAAVSVFAAFAGASMVVNMNEVVLRQIIAVIIISVLAIMLLKRKIGTENVVKNPGFLRKSVGLMLTFFGIFISNLAGGGGGTFLSYILIFLFGETFIESMGTRKVVTIASLITATAFFMVSGFVIYEIAIPLLITGTLGGWVGAKYAIKKGDKWVRVFFIVISFILAINMLVSI